MAEELRGTVAIVTTAGEEEGITAAQGLLESGAQVSLWSTEQRDLDQARTDFDAQGLQADLRRLDVADIAAVESAYEAVRSSLGSIDLLVNNATLRNTFMFGAEGDRASANFWELPLDRVQRAVDVNVMGAFNCARVVSKGMIGTGRGGSIVITTTSPSTQRSASHIPYGPSKAFIEAFVAAAAEQLKPHGVCINAVGSGGRVNRRGEHDPSAQPSDCMVPVILYLMSDAARDITGQVFSAASFSPTSAASR